MERRAHPGSVPVHRRGEGRSDHVGARAIARFPDTLPDLRGSHILPGCGHWVQQERADEVSRLLVDWLTSLQ